MNLSDVLKPKYDLEKGENSGLKTKYETLLIAILISSIGMSYGLAGNLIRGVYEIAYIEIVLVALNVTLFFRLREVKSSFRVITKILIAEFTIFFLYLYYFYTIEDLKFLWLYTYPIVLLYLQGLKYGIQWLLFMLVMIVVAPYQSVISVEYSTYQSSYIAFVFVVVSTVIYFYKVQMVQATRLISKQRENIENKYKELSKKDSMLTVQSKQAVMGEMMSMIAHQWRQPLSTVTLSISNLQFKKMLGQEVTDEELEQTLNTISDTVVYLSDTVDDFQTFFHPKKEKTTIEIHELLQRAVNFVEPRIKKKQIQITINKYVEIEVITYVNELVQIILNILNNAIDALISAQKEQAKIILYVELKGDYIYISIVDNANGIDEEHQESIFDPYFSTKGKNGTGLGLYMSQMLAQKQFDGDITFTSSYLGTHFLVKIKKDVSS